jgi:hypothetical protein
MTRRNRVTPLGELVADPARGLVFGNRGCLHDDRGEIRRHHQGRRWIACRLEFRGRRREIMRPGRYTELFFLDDATALAAGHRPCAECRREDYDALRELWSGCPGADAIDGTLHGERLGQRREAALGELPDGAFVLRDGAPWLVRGDALRRWTPAGYTDSECRTATRAPVLTPASLLAVLERGWRPTAVPLLHTSA